MTVTVTRAAPYLTVQDLGRPGFREFGVPRGGAMDRIALGSANALLGNPLDAPGFEWALGGGSLTFDEPSAFALSGAMAEATLDGAPVGQLKVAHAAAGAILEIGRFTSGRFLYVALAGGLSVELLLGSASTYLPAHFGGLDGRLIRTGDVLPIGKPAITDRDGFSPAADLQLDYSRRNIRVIPGPQWNLFSTGDRELFFAQRYTVAHSSDRMGYRLEGDALSGRMGLLPSEAACEGAIQVPPNGLPIVLMADSPTVGGYPKIGVVEGADLPALAQLQPGESFQFEQSTIQHSQRRLRRAATSLFTIASLATRV